MKKTVIFTSLTGGYDNLPQYVVMDPDFDYICFTNDFQDGSKHGIWEIRKIPYETKDKTRLSRYVKLNPHKVLPEYEFSLWIDSNILIINSGIFTRIKSLVEDDTLMASIIHPKHVSLYQDAKQCIVDGRDFAWIIDKQIKHLKANNYPYGIGLYENNVIFRKHNDNLIIKISNMWWNEFVSYSKRDQLSLCYVLWKLNFTPSLLLPSTNNTYNSVFFCRVNHKRSKIKRLKSLMVRIVNYIYMIGRNHEYKF